MSALTDRFYQAAPVWLQNAGINVFGLVWRRRRFGGVFPSALAGFKSRDRWSGAQWAEHQTAALRGLLRHSAMTVPFYRQRLSVVDLSVEELQRIKLPDLARLPLTAKEDIRKDPPSLISESYKEMKLHAYATSGTTGTPLSILFSASMHQTWSAAYEARCRNWAGIDHTMSRAMIGGRLVVPRAQKTAPYWRYNRVERQLYMSAFHISGENAPAYVEALNKYRPDYLVGYASSHYFLARFIKELNLAVYRPKAVLTSSEKLQPEMRRTIEGVYGCAVFDAYSGVEACCLAAECEHHRMHVSPDVGIVELCDESGRAVPTGQPGEIVATGLLNYAQPLVRYRTGDYAVLASEDCPCGRSMPVLQEVVGRLEDTVVGADGREMVRFHGIFVGLPNVREGQIVQEALTDFRVRLAVEPGFSEDERNLIVERLVERLGPVRVDFECVDRIERTERGKFRAVISKVNRREAGR